MGTCRFLKLPENLGERSDLRLSCNEIGQIPMFYREHHKNMTKTHIKKDEKKHGEACYFLAPCPFGFYSSRAVGLMGMKSRENGARRENDGANGFRLRRVEAYLLASIRFRTLPLKYRLYPYS